MPSLLTCGKDMKTSLKLPRLTSRKFPPRSRANPPHLKTPLSYNCFPSRRGELAGCCCGAEDLLFRTVTASKSRFFGPPMTSGHIHIHAAAQGTVSKRRRFVRLVRDVSLSLLSPPALHPSPTSCTGNSFVVRCCGSQTYPQRRPRCHRSAPRCLWD